MSTRITTIRIGTLVLGALATLAVAAAPVQAQRRHPPNALVMGHDVHLRLEGGGSAEGELLGVTDRSVSVLVDSGRVEVIGLGRVLEAEVARHSMGWDKVWTWAGLGGLLTGGGLAFACSQVSEGCGAVFAVTALSWGLYGGILGVIIDQQRWRWVAPTAEGLKAWSRYPQGCPEDRCPGR